MLFWRFDTNIFFQILRTKPNKQFVRTNPPPQKKIQPTYPSLLGLSGGGETFNILCLALDRNTWKCVGEVLTCVDVDRLAARDGGVGVGVVAQVPDEADVVALGQLSLLARAVEHHRLQVRHWTVHLVCRTQGTLVLYSYIITTNRAYFLI